MEKQKASLQILIQKRDELKARLNESAARIEEARTRNVDVIYWEDYWVRLNWNYEELCKRIAQLEAQSTA